MDVERPAAPVTAHRPERLGIAGHSPQERPLSGPETLADAVEVFEAQRALTAQLADPSVLPDASLREAFGCAQ